MADSTRRLHLRLASDNPIFDIPAGERTRQAEQWLRIGAEVERLERVVDKLERLAVHGQIPVQQIQEKPIPAGDKKEIVKNLVNVFENW